jgi:hypothetical protein
MVGYGEAVPWDGRDFDVSFSGIVSKRGRRQSPDVDWGKSSIPWV